MRGLITRFRPFFRLNGRIKQVAAYSSDGKDGGSGKGNSQNTDWLKKFKVSNSNKKPQQNTASANNLNQNQHRGQNKQHRKQHQGQNHRGQSRNNQRVNQAQQNQRKPPTMSLSDALKSLDKTLESQKKTLDKEKPNKPKSFTEIFQRQPKKKTEDKKPQKQKQGTGLSIDMSKPIVKAQKKEEEPSTKKEDTPTLTAFGRVDKVERLPELSEEILHNTKPPERLGFLSQPIFSLDSNTEHETRLQQRPQWWFNRSPASVGTIDNDVRVLAHRLDDLSMPIEARLWCHTDFSDLVDATKDCSPEIGQFMEAMASGFSRNPHISVEDKRIAMSQLAHCLIYTNKIVEGRRLKTEMHKAFQHELDEIQRQEDAEL